MKKRWVVADPVLQEDKQRFPDLNPVLLQLLFNRDVKTIEDIEVYLNPDWDRDTHDPSQFTRMKEAVDRVFAAFEKREVITVHGDYDADGVCGSTVLITTLRDICRSLSYQHKTTSYIPHREKEGYGMSVETVEYLNEKEKTKLVITVDCGISNKEAIDRGKELGIDTIVCDHHAMPKELPESAILIHPLVPGETFPNKHLCGTGVAFKLASGLLHEARARGADLPEGYEKWLLDLVAIATVTDVMPLSGENRVLEHYGLRVLNKTRRVGLKKLIEIAGGKMGELDTVSIGFVIGPRLNAAGRMTHADQALELMIEEDELKAIELANGLQETNVERQKASGKMFEEAERLLGEVIDQKLLVVSQEGWGAGLVGLVAGKLLHKHDKPVFVVGRDGDKYVGSGRSIDGFDVTKTLHAASEYLDQFGGHPQACGFSTSGEDRFNKAVELMQAYAKEYMTEELMTPVLKIDAQIELEDVDWPLLDHIDQIAPFGRANPRPLFLSKDLKLVSFSQVGKIGAHLKLRVQSKGGTIRNVIGFRFGHLAEKLKLGGSVDLVYEISLNEWNGNRELQLKIEDICV